MRKYPFPPFIRLYCLACISFLVMITAPPLDAASQSPLMHNASASLSVGTRISTQGNLFSLELHTLRKELGYQIDTGFFLKFLQSGNLEAIVGNPSNRLRSAVSCRLTFPDDTEILLGAVRPTAFALEMVRPMKLIDVFRQTRSQDSFFNPSSDSTSFPNFTAIAGEFALQCGSSVGTRFGLLVSAPFSGGRPVLTMFLCEITLPSSLISIGVMPIHLNSATEDDGSPAVSLPSVDWLTIHPQSALVAMGKFSVSPIDVFGISFSGGASFHACWDVRLGFGGTSAWWGRATRNELDVGIQWRRSNGGFQFAQPVGTQTQPIQLMEASLAYGKGWLRTDCRYQDTLFKLPVHGGLHQRREVRTSFSVSAVFSRATTYTLSVDDATTWYPNGTRRSLFDIGVKLKFPLGKIPMALTGELSWVRKKGFYLDRLSGGKVSLSIDAVQLTWDRGTFIITLEKRIRLTKGQLVFRLDTKRRASMIFSVSG